MIDHRICLNTLDTLYSVGSELESAVFEQFRRPGNVCLIGVGVVIFLTMVSPEILAFTFLLPSRQKSMKIRPE